MYKPSPAPTRNSRIETSIEINDPRLASCTARMFVGAKIMCSFPCVCSIKVKLLLVASHTEFKV